MLHDIELIEKINISTQKQISTSRMSTKSKNCLIPKRQLSAKRGHTLLIVLMAIRKSKEEIIHKRQNTMIKPPARLNT
jgi:hypothetical protein